MGYTDRKFRFIAQCLRHIICAVPKTGLSQVIKQATSVTSVGMQPLCYGLGAMGLALVAFQVLAMVLRQLLIAMVINSLKISTGSGLQTDD